MADLGVPTRQRQRCRLTSLLSDSSGTKLAVQDRIVNQSWALKGAWGSTKYAIFLRTLASPGPVEEIC